VGEFLDSLDAVAAYGARLALPGHGRTFADVDAHIEGYRALVHERLDALMGALRDRGPITAFEAVPAVHGAEATPATASWWVQETLCYLRHLEVTERAVAERSGDGEPERWRATL
jgi:hypothetical protein